MIKVAAGVILREDGCVLLCSRPVDKPPAGWEFPGGKIEKGETPGDALERELLEELNLAGRSGKELVVVPTEKVELHFIRFFPAPGALIDPREGQEFRWQSTEDEMPEDLLPNDKPVWPLLMRLAGEELCR